jgi:hypothetical protein
VLEPRGNDVALVRRAEDGEAGEELEEVAPAGADGAVEGGCPRRRWRAWR